MTQPSNNESTRLLSSSPPPNVNHSTRPSGSSASAPGMIQSVFQLMHGFGETFRGTVLGAIDDLENNGEQKHHNVARQGRAEIDEAYRQLWGTSNSATTPIQGQPAARTTGYDAAPPTYQSTNAANAAPSFRPDSKNSGA
ncbi:hypothetical protein C8F04DRAFT_1394487 [Mycena alexandri]|uniref:Uncharacterized protein n=1 Tax=Mycena alexandri TaxID=1745969 RepID=A0AAD6X8B3_9AGAR|nr:hypothetical protein C8F04DRAFT_1394487 [Mycena alexandri]